jgi:primosomal protein N' (replication factor Y) (superfamily II helicase)
MASSCTSSREAGDRRVGVLLPLPLAGVYDYLAPAELDLAPGDFVVVPLGNRQLAGVVWGDARGDVDAARLKTVVARCEAPPMADPMRRFVDWVAAYTMASPGAVLRMAMSIPEALNPATPIQAFTAVDETPEISPEIRMTAARQRVLAIAGEGPPRPATELARAAGVGVGVVRGLADAGALQRATLAAAQPSIPDESRPGPSLSPEQAASADHLRRAVAVREFSVSVLEGVPGSGKTEVYFEAIAEALAAGRQALVLLPEIALTAQWLDRFRHRFGAPPAEWHSDLGRAQRRRTWRAVAEGAVPVVVGARSALFLPFPDLGLVVVDEEHEAAYKQEEGVVYNARDMAVVRARLGDAPAVLVSATPSLESLVNVQGGRYQRLDLPARHGGATLPEVTIIDMRRTPPPSGRWLSEALFEALKETFADGSQAMLYLNRRGYAPLTLCRACGYRLQCPTCTAWLVDHRARGYLQCHHCGYRAGRPKTCPSCEAEDRFAACGPGVERLAEEVEALFPDIRHAIAASDTLTGPRAAEDLVRRIEDHDIDLIIGTQIVAKGYHFPLLTLVGVIDADLGLAGGDLRAAERTFQLLYQVAGRAGRADRPGRVLVQTFMPENRVMEALASGERERFIEAEIAARRDAAMPPFGRLVGLVVSSPDPDAAADGARRLARTAPNDGKVRVLGPAPAPLALLRGRHRHRLLLMAPKEVAVQGLVRPWLSRAALPRQVRVQVDVDPYSFL